MNKNLQVAKYIAADFFTAALAWTIFFIYRKWVVDREVFNNLQEIFSDRNLYLGIAIIPFFWLILYIIIGTYRKIYRKSRLKELGQTLSITFIGVTFLLPVARRCCNFLPVVLQSFSYPFPSALSANLFVQALHHLQYHS
jgi:hypothetical protein